MTNLNPITTTATAIADQLGETVGGARATIRRAVRTLGPERTQAFVAQALEVEANGGLLIPDGSRSRKRTLGGIFFSLVRTQISDDEAMQINRAWRWQQWKQRQPATSKASAAPTPPPLPPFVWDEADPIIAELTTNVGEASTVKVTVIGRPSQVVERQGVIILALRSTKPPTLPPSLPSLPVTPTNYMIFVQQKQWNKVREALQQPDDALIVEGYPVHEPRFAGITVYATHVTTKTLQAATRKEQAAAPVSQGEGARNAQQRAENRARVGHHMG
jgi:hypothetical protein